VQRDDTTRSNGLLRFGDLDVAAVRLRHRQRDRQILLWYASRATAKSASGHVGRAGLRAARLSLKLSSRTGQRLVEGGTPAFWIPDGSSGLYLRAPARVAVALGVQSFRAAFFRPRCNLRGPVGDVRARLALQGVAAIRCGLPTSNAAIAKMLGVSTRTVRLWTRSAGVRIRQNFALVAPLSKNASVADFFHTTGEAGLRALTYGGRIWLARQLPNSFSVPLSRGVRSRLRHANRHLRRLTGARASSDYRAGGTAQRYRRADRYRAGLRPDPTISTSANATYVPVGVGRMRGRRISLWEPYRPNR